MKVAIVGCGSIGSRYLRWLYELGHQVAACDTSSDRLGEIERDGYASTFDDIASILTWTPDRVIVSTPPHRHEVASVLAMEAGVPVLIEKPVAHDLEAARRIAIAAKKARAPVRVVCNMRFHVGIETVKANLDRIGRPMAFRSVFGHRLSQMRVAGGDFARDAATGGGVIFDCIHEFDYLRWLFGPVAEIQSAITHTGVDPIDAEDLAQVLLTFESGMRGSLHLDFLMRQKRRGLEVIGTDGNLIWLSTGRAPEVCRVSFGDQSGETLLLDEPNLDPQAGYLRMLDRFLGNGEDLQSVDEALAALETAIVARSGV